VFSTIDMPAQIAAEAAVADSLKALDARRDVIARRRLAARTAAGKALPDVVSSGGPTPDPSDVLQAALVALDPRTGHVRAMVGGRDFGVSSFNRAVQAERQPGSAFKPFVYATAIEAGYTPATIIDRLDDRIDTVHGAWAPEDEHSSASSMSLRTGLRTSSNRAAVRLLQQVGIARTVQYAKAMGIGDMPNVPSLALGSGEVTLESMTAAYAAFANGGLVPRPLLIRRVEDREGRVLFEARSESTRVIRDSTAFLMATMLADVINAGTASRARQMGFTLPAAGKTGTTNNFNDAWFVGFTPSLVTGVWVGFDQPHTILPNGFAAEVAVPMWTTFMKAATRGAPAEWLRPPDGVTMTKVCRLSGHLATSGCDDVYAEYFAAGTTPRIYCDQHPTRGILAVAELLGVETPLEPPAPPRAGPILILAPSGPAPPPPTLNESSAGEKPRGFWSRLIGRKKGRD
jgi:membrane carboxypeptidase/penicillin-binding protein